MNRRREPSLLRLPASVIALLALAGPAVAADIGSAKDLPLDEPASELSDWSFALTTYSWVAGLSGDAVVKGRAVEIDASATEILDHLDWDGIPAWMSYAEARRGPLSLFNDIVYSKLTGSTDFVRSVRRGAVAARLGADISADFTQATVEFGGAYEVRQWRSAASSGANGSLALDVLAGGRYWYQKLNLSADLSGTADVNGLTISGDRALARSGSVDWVDPFVGARLRYQRAIGEEVVLRGDIGGFGAGSDFSWQLIGTYNWQLCTVFGMNLVGYVGYRALAVDYSEGAGRNEYSIDAVQHGPVIGVTTRF